VHLAIRVLKAALMFVSCTVFLVVAYFELIEFQRGRPVGLLQSAVSFTRHVLLVAGLLPLLIALIWAARFHSPRQFWLGALVVAVMVILHFWVFAVSAHSDAGYIWVQLVEAVVFAGALWVLARPVAGLK
jgi:hypothetical protein